MSDMSIEPANMFALGDFEESRPLSPDENERAQASTPKLSDETSQKKRFLPGHKKPDAALTFGEKMMNMMRYAETKGDGFCVAWEKDGKTFIIRNPDQFASDVIPLFFKPAKFSSFTRKLYRWGFRQVNRGLGPDDPVIFGNEHFQRDREELIANMRSITAAATRKAEEKQSFYSGIKHQLSVITPPTIDEGSHKRLMLEHIQQSKVANSRMNHAQFNMNDITLTNSIRPHMDMQRMSMQEQGFRPEPMKFPHFRSTMPYRMNNQESASTTEIVNAAIAALRQAN